MKEREELEFIQKPLDWPRWPVLPVVRRNTDSLVCGLVFATGHPEVYVGANLFALHEVEGKTYDVKLSHFEKREYPSFAELLREWRID